MHNDTTKQFLREAGPAEHICLSIARETLKYVMYFSQNDRILMQNSFFPHYNYLCSALNQISFAERLTGTAQFYLMKSLHLHSSTLKVIENRTSLTHVESTFVFRKPSGILFDVVDMTAYRSMLLFICKVLGLPSAQSQSNPKRLSVCQQSYHKNDPLTLRLKWVSAPNYERSFSRYRQQLRKCLR